MAMFYKNICRFGQCGMEFADLYDLIQHIEETHIPADADKKVDSQAVSAPLSAICRYFQKLPDQPARPIIPEPTYQQPISSVPPGAQAAAAMAAAAAAASVKKRIPSIIAQPSPAGSGLITSGGQSVPQPPVTQTTSILFHPPANVVVRAAAATPASLVSDRDDDSVSVGRESLSSESSMVVEDGGNELSSLYKIISPTGSNEDRRFLCAAPGCKKSYKNMNGIRYHIKIAHVHTGVLDTQPNAKKFRCQCGKAYKTSHGLHNHMLQTHHRQAPVPSSSAISNSAIGSAGAGSAGGGSKYSSAMAGVSATASQYKRLPGSLMTTGGSGSAGSMTSAGPKHQAQGSSSVYYSQQAAMKASGGGGSSSTTTLPSGVSVQVSNMGGGTPTTVQVGQQGALGVAGGSSSGGPVGPGQGGGQSLHISAGRRLSTAHTQQQHMNSMGGRSLKIHSAISSVAGSGIVVGGQSTLTGVSAYNSPTSVTTTLGGSGGDKAAK